MRRGGEVKSLREGRKDPSLLQTCWIVKESSDPKLLNFILITVFQILLLAQQVQPDV